VSHNRFRVKANRPTLGCTQAKEFRLFPLPDVIIPADLQRRISRRALACARRLIQMRREPQDFTLVMVWPDLRRDAAGSITSLRFRLGKHQDALQITSVHGQAKLAAILEWHASECIIREVIFERMGNSPLLAASDADLVALLDVLPLDPRMSVWADLAEKELAERESESAHRQLARYAARKIWLRAQEEGS
jgi:hypothetical protein